MMPIPSRHSDAMAKYNKYCAWVNDSTVHSEIKAYLISIFDHIKDRLRAIEQYTPSLEYEQTNAELTDMIGMMKQINCLMLYEQRNNASREVIPLLEQYAKDIQLKKYLIIRDAIDNKLSGMDQAHAEDYFKKHPQAVFAGHQENLLYSYVRTTENTSIRRSTVLGSGQYGVIKVGHHNHVTSAIKRQKSNYSEYPMKQRKEIAEQCLKKKKTQLAQSSSADEQNMLLKLQRLFEQGHYDTVLTEYHWLPMVQKEARANLNQGVANSPLVIRRNTDGLVYKVYQDMTYLGMPLSHILHDNPDANKRMQLAIDLLLRVDALHTGASSKTGEPCVHLDIKPDNILIDKNGLHLIDFGFSRDTKLNRSHQASNGTPQYLPIDIPYTVFSWPIVYTTPSYFFDDKIATLRTIYSQGKEQNILTRQMFEHLPHSLQMRLQSDNMSLALAQDKACSVRFLAAALILYQMEPAFCTEEILADLAQHSAKQCQLIEQHKHSPSSTLAPDDLLKTVNIDHSKMNHMLWQILVTQYHHMSFTSLHAVCQQIESIHNTTRAFSPYQAQKILAELPMILQRTDPEYNAIQEALDKLRHKTQSYLQDSQEKLHGKAEPVFYLYLSLNQLTKEHLEGKWTKLEYQQKSLALIETYQPILAKHRTHIKETIYALMNAFLYFVNLILHTKIAFFQSKTDGTVIAEELKNAISLT